jgi:alpha-tubulin suppressor-like RCC1 family protein
MTIFVNNSGVWAEIIEPYVNDAGTWRTLKTQSVNDASTWRTVFPTFGSLLTWGSNFGGPLGNNTTTDRSTPVTTFAGGTNWKQVASGYRYTAAVKTDGTLWTWGRNTNGQLGNNTTTDRSTPVTTFAGGTNWRQVFCSETGHTVAIKTDGTLWTWGRNINGQLGDNTSVNRSTPVTTFAGGTNWIQSSCGGNITAAIKTDGTLWTWGSNLFGPLGDNATRDRSTPVTTFAGGTNWKQVFCKYSSVAAIKTDGTLWTWGRNYFLNSLSSGKLGNNTTVNRSTPVTTFAGGNNWKQVSMGYSQMSAIKTDGTLWSWGGRSTQGLLGNNLTNSSLTPVTTFAGGTNWRQVGCGEVWTAAIKTDGTLWAWGLNGYGVLGLGTNFINPAICTPVVSFAGSTNWKQVSGGVRTVAAIR